MLMARMLTAYHRCLFVLKNNATKSLTFVLPTKMMTNSAIFAFLVEVASEKAQQAVLKGVEGFDPSKLKHAETQEKVILPGAEGKDLLYPSHALTSIFVN